MTFYLSMVVCFWILPFLVIVWPLCFVFLLRKHAPFASAITTALVVLVLVDVGFGFWDPNPFGRPSENYFLYFFRVSCYLGPFSLVLGFIELIIWRSLAKPVRETNPAVPMPVAPPEGGVQNLGADLWRAGWKALAIGLGLFGIWVVVDLGHAQQVYALERALRESLRKDSGNLQPVEDLLVRYRVAYTRDQEGIWARIPTRNPFSVFEDELLIRIQTRGDVITGHHIHYGFNAP